jgi:hypothetical protein
MGRWDDDEAVRATLRSMVPELDHPADRLDRVRARVGRRRAARAAPVLAAAVVAVAVLLVGPGPGRDDRAVTSPATSRESAGPTSATGPAGPSCQLMRDDEADRQAGGDGVVRRERLAESFEPVAVVTCAYEQHERPDGSTDQVLVERRSSQVEQLATAFRAADGPPANACAAIGYIWRWVMLVDARGDVVVPAPPVQSCGEPKPAVDDALADAGLVTVSTTTIRQTESALAARSGCSQSYKNMVAVEAAAVPASGPGDDGLVLEAGAEVRSCVYEVPAEAIDDQIPVGELIAGRVLTGADGTALAALTTGQRAAEPCDRRPSRFAVVSPTDGGGQGADVELDGCGRMLLRTGSGQWLAQAGTPLISLLDPGAVASPTTSHVSPPSPAGP